MGIMSQMRRGIEKLIGIDVYIGIVTRHIKADNGRGQLSPTGETKTHSVICRVSYQSGGVWRGKQWEGGLTIDTSPYVLASHNADIEQGDILEWRGMRYTVGVVSHPQLGGGRTCTQAPLTEVK